jgi:N-acetylmuramic acid 6-phosphate etherase
MSIVSEEVLPLTESINPRTRDIDVLDVADALRLINDEDAAVHLAVREAIPQVALLVDSMVDVYGSGGRVLFLGAGTSGRLGTMEAAECPPTFGIERGRIVSLMAGGLAAFVDANEGLEDDAERGRTDVRSVEVGGRDLVIGLTANGATPYVRAGLVEAKACGACTALLVCNPTAASPDVDILVEALVGPEVIAGSTRMKAATAQKLILNMLTTVSMVRLGKVYQNLMVDLRPTNAKLRQRSHRVVALATGQGEADVTIALRAAAGRPKVAILMLLAGISADEALRVLAAARGHLREALLGMEARG